MTSNSEENLIIYGCFKLKVLDHPVLARPKHGFIHDSMWNGEEMVGGIEIIFCWSAPLTNTTNTPINTSINI